MPAAALVLFWAFSSLFSGAYFPSAWYPAAITTVVLCPLLLAAGWRLPAGGTRLTIVLLAAFVAWTAISILWAGAGGHALEATNKLLLALASAFVFAITPWTERRASWLLCLLATSIAFASAATLIAAAGVSNPSSYFIERRFTEPLGYAGASAAFAALAVWPAMSLAARRTWPSWARAAMLAVAVVQVELALLPQSRGALIGLAVGAVVFVGLTAHRGWAMIRLAVMAIVGVLTIGPVLDVYSTATEGGSIHAALDHALVAVTIAAGACFLVGLLIPRLESARPELVSPVAARRASIVSMGLLVVVGAALAIVFGGRASHEVSQRWDQFKSGETADESSSRFVSTGDPERYDYWRVALDTSADSPLVGAGAGNFQDEYTIHRHETKPSRYAHDIWLETLSNTGIVGLILLLAALIVAFLTLARARRQSLSPPSQLVIAGAAAAAAYVFTHASVDWVDQFPAVLGPALGLLLMATRLASQPAQGLSRRQSTWLLTGMVLSGAALVALVPAYLSVRFVDRALGTWVTDRSAAYSDLDRAAYLNPFSSQADLTAGEIAIAFSEDGRARHEFEQAISREDNWYPHFELAALASRRGDAREALTQMRAAKRMNPLDSLVEDNLALLQEGKRLNPAAIQNQAQQLTRERFFHLKRAPR